jgi:hypothetical protein
MDNLPMTTAFDPFASPSSLAVPVTPPTPWGSTQPNKAVAGAPVVDMFATPSDNVGGPRTTDHHDFPLPPRLRAFEVERNRFGHYMLPSPITGTVEGGTRTTTLADTLDDTYNLDKYKQRMIIHGLKVNPDLLDDIDVYGEWRDVNADIYKVVDKAMVLAGDAHGRELGTAVHEWLEVIDGGKLNIGDVPTIFAPKCRAYLDTIHAAGIEPIPELVERIVRNERSKNTGTFDRIYKLADGSLVIGDVKTGKDLQYSYMAIAAQLASYADAEYMLSEDGKSWVPMPEVRKDYAVVLWVPSDKDDHAEVVTIDLEFGRRVLEYALAVREMRTAAKKQVANVWTIPAPAAAPVVVEVAAPAATEAVAENGMFQWAYDELVGKIKMATCQAHLATLWEQYSAYWSPALTGLANEVMAGFDNRIVSANPYA